MIDNDKPRDDAAEKELEGVPEHMLDDGEGEEDADKKFDADIEQLLEDIEKAKQDVLYAKADAQNVRRRAEKDIVDARNYAATAFARDILSVADNLARAIDAVPEEMRGDSKFKPLVDGIQATQRELDKVFSQHGITRVAAMGMPLDPNQHQAMLEVPTDEAEPGTVVQEMQSGYMIKDRLLRPAMVGVAKKPN